MFVDIAARSRIDPLHERAAAWHPDLVVHDQSEFAAPIVAATLGVPTAVHSWGPMMPAELLVPIEPAVEALAAEHGVTGVIAKAVEESVYVDICPPGLQSEAAPDGGGSNRCATRTPRRRRAPRRTWRRRSQGCRTTTPCT